jgi:hypothetical protein
LEENYTQDELEGIRETEWRKGITIAWKSNSKVNAKRDNNKIRVRKKPSRTVRAPALNLLGRGAELNVILTIPP